MHAGLASKLDGYYPCPASYIHGDDVGAPFHNWTDGEPRYRSSFAEALRHLVRHRSSTSSVRATSSIPRPRAGGQRAAPPEGLRRVGLRSADGGRPAARGHGLVPDAPWAREHPEPVRGRQWQPVGDILTMTGAGNIAGHAAAARAGLRGDRERRAPVPPAPGRAIETEDGELVKEPGAGCDRTLAVRPGRARLHPRRARGVVVASGTASVRLQRVPALAGPRGRQDGDRRARLAEVPGHVVVRRDGRSRPGRPRVRRRHDGRAGRVRRAGRRADHAAA